MEAFSILCLKVKIYAKPTLKKRIFVGLVADVNGDMKGGFLDG